MPPRACQGRSRSAAREEIVSQGGRAGERSDLGWTHVALPAHDLEASIAFYQDYAGLRVVHDRTDDDGGRTVRVLWLADGERPFVLVLAQSAAPVSSPLGPFAHLGIALHSAAAVDEIARRARAEGRLSTGPVDCGPPVGYLCMLRDPDGHTIEFAYGQEVGLAVDRVADSGPTSVGQI